MALPPSIRKCFSIMNNLTRLIYDIEIMLIEKYFSYPEGMTVL